jgi:adenosine deaminase
VEYKNRGVVAFDLAGAEAGHPASVHAEAFRYARTHGLHCTCHAGEGAGAESVAEAVRVCQVHRVGHATHLIDDPVLTDEVKADGITLELCLTSNVQTHATESYEAHPLRRYLARGVKVVLNTDNRLMSGVSLVDEYQVASRTFGLSFDELAGLALNGFDAAFLPEGDRARLRAAALARLEALRR